MKAKIIGIAVFLALVVAVTVTGISQVAQALDESQLVAGGEKLAALNSPLAGQQDAGETNPVYGAFTFVCPFH